MNVTAKIPPKEHRKLKVEDKLSFLFDRLIFAKAEIMPNTRKDCRFLPHEMGPMWARVDTERDELLFHDGAAINSPDVVWPISVGMVWHHIDNPEWGNSIHCDFFQSEPASKLRGQWRNVGRKNIGWYKGILHSDLKFTSSVMYGAWHLGKWQTCQRLCANEAIFAKMRDHPGGLPIEPFRATGEDDIGSMCALGQSAALTYRYEWGAQFSIGKSARIIVPTTPRGILELFNDRDKPEDRDRRAALRHWVNAHARRRKTSASFAHVRAHLRGQTSFNWRGFDVTIRPSAYDEEQNMARTEKPKPSPKTPA